MSRRGPKGKERQHVLDCTSECSLPQHSRVVLSCVALGNLKLLQHCASLCGNPFRITDGYGRNALHIAASKGHLHIVEWLLSKKRVSVDLGDFESRWSALHRSIYFGYLGVAVALVKRGASLVMEDLDGCNPLSLLNSNKSLLTAKLAVSAVNVYTWGSNPNVTLGHEHSKEYPERLEVAGRHTITQVILCKFHSVLLTREGRILTCGHGHGGRLGHGNEQSVVSPCVVESLRGVRCTAIAAARDHTAVLDEHGVVYTFGLNDAHQLGHGFTPANAPPLYDAPKPVTQKLLRNKAVISVGVGRYHTAVCTSTEVYTFGKNLGQLGYEKSSDTQIPPRAAPQVVMDQEDSIMLLSVSDAATACVTRKHRIFVCMGYSVKSIRCGFFEKACCVQFNVCASLSDLDHLRKTQTEPTKILMLDSDHQVWFWQPMHKGSTPTPLSGLARHKVKQFYLGKSLTVVTVGGEVYTGPAVVPLGERPSLQLARVPMAQNAHAVFTDFKSNNYAYIQNVYRSPDLPSVAPSTLSHDLSALLEEACLPGSVSDIDIEVGNQLFTAHKYLLASASPTLASLLQPSHSTPPSSQLPASIKSLSTSKMVLRDCEPSIFEAFLHYLYCSHIRVVPQDTRPLPLVSTGGTSAVIEVDSTPDTSFASVDENGLTALYDRYGVDSAGEVLDSSGGLEVSLSDSQSEGDPCHAPMAMTMGAARGQSTPKKRSHSRSRTPPDLVCEGEPIKELRTTNTQRDAQALMKLAKDFDTTRLKMSLGDLHHTLSLKHIYDPVTLAHSRSSLQRKAHPTLSDLILRSEDNQELHCHRCVLVARSEYFRSMLLMGWRESSVGTESLSLPVSYRVLKTVIDFMYTDQANSITASLGSESIDWVTSVLVVADQLLITRLKDLCECALASSLTLRNVSEVLEFAVAYSASQLKRACLKFMCVNASALLEGRYLEGLGSSLLTDLSAAYQELVPAVTRRVISFPAPDLSSLPGSYFLEDDHLSDEGSEEETPEGSFSATPTPRDDRDSMRSPTAYDTPSSIKTPTSTSSSRKKRRRKTSQSESKRTHASSPPVASPDHTPQTPLENGHRVEGQDSPELATNRLSSPLSPRHTENPFQKVRRKPRTKLLNRFDEASPPKDQQRSSWKGDPVVKGVPVNVNGVQVNRHTQLSQNGVPASCTNEATVGTDKQDCPVRQVSPPKPTEEFGCEKQNTGVTLPLSQAGRSAWAGLSPRPAGSPSSQGSSLRDIMAQEEQLAHKQARNNPSPQNHPGLFSPTAEEERHKAPVHKPSSSLPARSSSQPVPCRRQSSKEKRDSSFASASPSSVSSPHSPLNSNPWKGSGVATSPTVSMRELMAEETEQAERERQRQQCALSKGPTVTRPHAPQEDGRSVSGRNQPPVMVPHRKVSFADIVQAQELEQEDQRKVGTGKPLSLIQIEEQAIQQLEKLYSVQDNPDEYITVSRYHPRPRPSLSRSLSHDSPWSREVQ